MTEYELIHKMAEQDFDNVFPERKGDCLHPLNKSIYDGLYESAKIHLQVVKQNIGVIAAICPICRGAEAYTTSKTFNFMECECRGTGVVLRTEAKDEI